MTEEVTIITDLDDAATAELPLQYDFPDGHRYAGGHGLALDVITDYYGYAGIPVYTVSFLEWDLSSPYAEDGEGVYNCCNSESYLSEAEARAAFVRRAQAVDPIWAQPGNGLAKLAHDGLRRSLNRYADHVQKILLGTLSTNSSERANQLFGRFISRNRSSDCGGPAVHAAFQGNGEDVVVLPAWKLLEIKVALTALELAYGRRHNPDQTWEQVWASMSCLGDQVNQALDGLTTTSKELSGDRSAVMIEFPAVVLQSTFAVLSTVSLALDDALVQSSEIA